MRERVLELLRPVKGPEVLRCSALSPLGHQCKMTEGHRGDGSHLFAYHMSHHAGTTEAWADKLGVT